MSLHIFFLCSTGSLGRRHGIAAFAPVDWLNGIVQARQPNGLGLKVSFGVGDEDRYPVLGGDVGNRCRELLRATARAREMIVHAGSINRDHVHMLLLV